MPLAMPITSTANLSRRLRGDDWEIVGHGRSVARRAVRLARQLGLEPEDQMRLRLAALVHDIGKLAIPESILAKPGSLDQQEWAQVRCHPATGARMLEADGFDEIAGWIRAHHERPDGLGYPDGLRGEEIPIQARILAVADAYDAMLSDRPYSPAMDPAEAREELRRGAGAQFDAVVVAAFLACEGERALASVA